MHIVPFFYLFKFKRLQEIKILTVKIRYSVQLQKSVEYKSARCSDAYDFPHCLRCPWVSVVRIQSIIRQQAVILFIPVVFFFFPYRIASG